MHRSISQDYELVLTLPSLVLRLWVVKTSHIHKFNNLATEPFSSHPIKFSHGSAAPAPPRMGCCCVPFPRGPDPRKPCPASATARLARGYFRLGDTTISPAS